MNVIGKNVVLRALELDDVATIQRWSNDPEIQEQLGGWHFPLSRASLETWIRSFRYDSPDQRLMINGPSVGSIGIVTLTSINWKDRNAFHGVLIGEPAQQRKGHATDATVNLMRYAFEELGMQRLDTTIIEYNHASLKLHVDRLGWVEEGRKPKAVFRKDRYWTNVLLGITRDRYDANVASGRYAQYLR